MADSSQPQRFCRKCGGQVRPGTAFCISCGAPLSTPQASAGHGEESSSGREEDSSPGPRVPWTQWASFAAIAGLVTGLRGLVSKKVIVMIMGVAGATATAIGAMSDVSSLGVNIINPGANDVEIVDLGFTEGSGALDLKLENVGEDPVFFKRADLQIERVWTLVPPYYYDPDPDVCPQSEAVRVAPSFDYEVSISTQGAPHTATTALSQSIKPNETDRFTITPIPDSAETSTEADYIYLMSLSLVYGSDDSVLSSQDLLFAADLSDDSRSYQPGDCLLAESNAAQLEAENKQALSEIKDVQAKEDPYLEQLYQRIQ